MCKRGARAHNGSMGAEPQRGPREEPLVRGQGQSPTPEAESILSFRNANLSMFVIL